MNDGMMPSRIAGALQLVVVKRPLAEDGFDIATPREAWLLRCGTNPIIERLFRGTGVEVLGAVRAWLTAGAVDLVLARELSDLGRDPRCVREFVNDCIACGARLIVLESARPEWDLPMHDLGESMWATPRSINRGEGNTCPDA